MNQSRIDNEGSDFYRTPRTAGMSMRRFDVRPREEAPESSGWAWFVMGMACGALLIAAVLA